MFKAGDAVRIKKDLDKLRFNSDPGVTYEMREYEDKEDTIEEVFTGIDRPETIYKLTNNPWAWSESWLEPIVIYNIKEIEDAELVNMFK